MSYHFPWWSLHLISVGGFVFCVTGHRLGWQRTAPVSSVCGLLWFRPVRLGCVLSSVGGPLGYGQSMYYCGFSACVDCLWMIGCGLYVWLIVGQGMDGWVHSFLPLCCRRLIWGWLSSPYGGVSGRLFRLNCWVPEDGHRLDCAACGWLFYVCCFVSLLSLLCICFTCVWFLVIV